MASEFGDLDLIKLFADREQFDKFFTFVERRAVLEESWHILEGIQEYYSSHPAATEIDWSRFRTTFLGTRATKLGPVMTGTLATILDTIIANPDPTEEQDELVRYFIKVYHATQIREVVDGIIAGRNLDLDAVRLGVERYESDAATVSMESLEEILSFADMEATYDRLYRSGGLEWRLEDLNVSVGPPHPGDLICVTACPNVGKTRFITSEITHMVTQYATEDRRILFINNEETADAVWNAIYCSYFGKTDDDVAKNVAKYKEKWDKEVGEKAIAVMHDPNASTRDIERMIKAYDPKLVVYNQLYKVRLLGKKVGTEAEEYRLRYNFARIMADRYSHIAIAAHQAGALAAGEKWVTQEQMYGGKTGIPGECDVIIGIGKTYDPTAKKQRYLNIARNKLPSGPRTRPELREDSHFEVKFEAAKGRYETLEFK